jgi:hypothetical protein
VGRRRLAQALGGRGALMVAGSILQDNLEPFLTTLSWLIGYSFDEDDWQVINNDLLDGGGGAYEWVGNQTMKFDVAGDHNLGEGIR